MPQLHWAKWLTFNQSNQPPGTVYFQCDHQQRATKQNIVFLSSIQHHHDHLLKLTRKGKFLVSTIMKPKKMVSIQHNQETFDNAPRYTSDIRYTTNPRY